VVSLVKNSQKSKIFFIFLLFIILIILIGIAACFGSVNLSFIEVYQIIFSKFFPFYIKSDPSSEYIIWNLRLPRLFGAIIVGSALSAGGAICQAILRNPLASPFTMGLSSAAGFGASLAIILGAGVLTYSGGYTYIITNELLVISNAFIFCILCALIVSFLAKIKGFNPTTIILAGVAIGYFFSAGTSILQYFSQAEALKAVIMWLLGDLGRSSWKNLPLMSLALITIPFLLTISWKLNALNLGDDTAISLGVNIKKLRMLCILIVSFMTSITISFVGVISFICLISPHIARMIVGNNNEYLIVTSSLIGAILLLIADTIARTIMSPLILPIGAITSCIGGPFFIYLLLKSRRSYFS